MARIKGLKAVKGLLKSYKTKVDKAVNRGIIKTAHDIKDDARSAAPEDMGKLKRSIDVEVRDKSAVVYADPAVAPYAPYVEFGTGGFALAPAPEYVKYMAEFIVNREGTTRPQPFLFPAFFKHKENLVQNVEEEIKKIK